ncbi:ABC transporter ATP-binding protein [Pelotomaculum propionicicum]|uniref:Ferric enterobactin transport ATP-binding protein FepC n=1 Tax=Pelotomaculum propionicicum TaxID=258475 RepID=A0A4Y7RNH1_9FIRM|nr:ABC transporter ATP-binding protein [Pelotomaculum propionicicum]TEB10403.1 Ferric enterobactin transport ATP-binding protein FepC [Pelotomaculum propionicicum]
MNVLQAKELAVGYDSRTVVGGINLEALKGQFICLLGPNGSGKSTILRCLAGLLAPLQGSVFLKGNLLYRMEPKELSRTMAVVLTERLSPGLITVFDVAAMGRYPYTDFFGRLSGEDIQKTWEALCLVNAHDLAERYFDELSDGEKQKVLLARALVQEPEVIILDEPTSHLDVKHRLEVMKILRQLTKEKGITVILSLHEIDLALKSCETALLVKNGRILTYGAPEEILSEEMVAELYDIESANFSNYLGGIELRNSGGTRVYVLAGAGSGAPVYRLLNKFNFSVITGVIHENDIDYHVGKALGATVISEKPFEEISAASLNKAVILGQQADCVIDAGCPIGSLNRRNVEIIKQLLARDKIIYCLRSKQEARRLYGADDARLKYFPTIVAMVEKLNARGR